MTAFDTSVGGRLLHLAWQGALVGLAAWGAHAMLDRRAASALLRHVQRPTTVSPEADTRSAWIRAVVLCIALTCVGVTVNWAPLLGHPSAQPPATVEFVPFEVESVKPSGPSRPIAAGTVGFLPGGRYVARNTTVATLIAIAYRQAGPGSLGMDRVDTSHVPSWVASSRFDINARAAGVPAWTGDEVEQPYLRALLRDRFNVQVHFEKRDLPLYWMTLAKKDRTLGPNMKRTSAYDCDDVARLRRENPSALPPPSPEHPLCMIALGRGTITGGNVSSSMFAQSLRGTVGAPILDHTGLTGSFDLDVHYDYASGGRGPTTADPANPASISEWPQLITAIEDQLGLKLEPHREPQEVLVVDHADQPTAN
jgi:uncharacterized protein (TIGR03435 family)